MGAGIELELCFPFTKRPCLFVHLDKLKVRAALHPQGNLRVELGVVDICCGSCRNARSVVGSGACRRRLPVWQVRQLVQPQVVFARSLARAVLLLHNGIGYIDGFLFGDFPVNVLGSIALVCSIVVGGGDGDGTAVHNLPFHRCGSHQGFVRIIGIEVDLQLLHFHIAVQLFPCRCAVGGKQDVQRLAVAGRAAGQGISQIITAVRARRRVNERAVGGIIFQVQHIHRDVVLSRLDGNDFIILVVPSIVQHPIVGDDIFALHAGIRV